jgi:hypothetical protein
MTTATFTSFSGSTRIASGTLHANVLAVKHALDAAADASLLIFDDQTGRVVDVDLRGSDADALARLPQAASPEIADADADSSLPIPRGRGRPKLGVVAREVTLLPRQWEWLATQPGGASVALRKLVDEARRGSATADQRRAAQESAYRFMSAMAGDLAGFEESTRALFAGDADTLRELSAAWPADVRDYALQLAGFTQHEAP